MSGRARLAVCAAVATLASSCALLPLIDRATWFLQAALLVLIQSSVGALARRVPLARALTVLAQAVVALLLLTLLFAQSEAIGGLLPGPDVFHEFGQLLREGADDVGRYAIPAPATEGIKLLLVGGVLVVGLTVDALAVTYRSAAPAGLPLLALYSVAAGLAKGGADWLWFLAAAGGFLLLLLAEGRDRLSQWGRVFAGGGARRPTGPGSTLGPAPGAVGPALAPVRTGRRIGALALGIALAVPAVLPTMDDGLLGSRGAGAGQESGGGTISAVNPLVSLQNSLNQPENHEVLRYRTSTGDTQNMYLRIVALDQFDGSSWKASERHITDVPDPLPTPSGLSPDVRTDTVNTSVVAAETYGQTYLPLPYPATQVSVGGRWRFEPEGRTLVGDHGQTTRGSRYQVSSLLVQPTSAQLAAAPAPPKRFLDEYTKVPGSLPSVVRDQARKVTAGAATAYERAVKLQEWFSTTGGFRYNTEVRSGSGSSAIAKFLHDKEGFCVHFSFSMAAMARTLGIPARVAVGFTPGTPQVDGTMSVGSKDAHAWPELYFEGVGWTRFEPTPSRGSQPEYTIAQTPSGTDPGSPSAAPSRSAAPSAGASASQGCDPRAKRLGECGAAAQQASGGSGDGGGPTGAIVAGSVGVLVLLALALPMLWRTRVRARRLGESGGRTPQDGADRTLAAWRELIDSGWDYGVPPDDSQTPRKAAARIVRLGGLDTAAAEAAHRVAAAVEQVLYAPRPRPVSGLAGDVERVRSGLRASAGRAGRLRGLLAPRSTVRVLWSLSRRWTTAVARLRTGRLGSLARRAGSALRFSRQRA
ncbi:DUF3488 and transglutaminase-like domain-containing protein [Streptomyces sp. NPDC050617]|uniref:transglutaminase family protein n=1 Tax=Streptomyces sp. NPDC050617 TaxID=3154628 RepID=UPI003420F07A